jgi:hypothetical protein
MNPSHINRNKVITKLKINSELPKTSIFKKENTKIEVVEADKNYYKNKSSITKKISSANDSIPLEIKCRLPTIINCGVEDCESYKYYIKKIINIEKPNFKSDKKINICIYNIVNVARRPPFILYLLYKNSKNILTFPRFETSDEVFNASESKLDIIYQNYKVKPEFVGYYESDNQIYVFYNFNHEYTLEELNSKSNWWWSNIFEIINHKKIMNFLIDSSVYNIFLDKPLLSVVFSNKNYKFSSGNVLYFGGEQNYISFIAALGLAKESPTSNLGPFYYFYTFFGAGRRAIWNLSRKSQERNGEEITRNEFGVYKRGGVVRFITFGSKTKYFLNRDSDKKDDSEISQELSKTSEFINETLKIRDTDGNWAVNHDIAYIGSTTISTTISLTSKKEKSRRLYAQWAFRDYYQFLPLTYHYVNTDRFAKVTDKDDALSLPFEYKEYSIE